MIRFRFNLQKWTVAFGVGCGLLYSNSLAVAAGFPQFGGAVSGRAKQVGGAISAGSKHTGSVISHNGKPAGHAIQHATHTAGRKGQQLGNSVPVQALQPNYRAPTQPGNSRLDPQFKPQLMRDRIQPVVNQGGKIVGQAGQTVNSGVTTTNRASQHSVLQRTVVNPMPVGIGPSQLQKDVRNTKIVAGVGLSAIGTNVNAGTSAAGKLVQQSRKDVEGTARQLGKSVLGPQTQITKKWGPKIPEIKIPKPQPLPRNDGDIIAEPGGARVLALPQPPLGPFVPQPNQAADTLNGVANLVGAIVSASQMAGASNNAVGYGESPQLGSAPGGDFSSQPMEQMQPVYAQPQPVETSFATETAPVGEPLTAPLVLYNAGTTEQVFQLEVGHGQTESASLQPGEAVEVQLAKVVITFTAGQQPRRYTLSAGEAYKFAPGHDGLGNLFSFDPSTLAAE